MSSVQHFVSCKRQACLLRSWLQSTQTWLPIMHPPGYDTCIPANDPTAFKLSALISVGVLVSYLPQMFRIVYNKTSEGIDPLFLLLGSTSSASSFLNIVALSWSAVRCCSFLVGWVTLRHMLSVDSDCRSVKVWQFVLGRTDGHHSGWIAVGVLQRHVGPMAICSRKTGCITNDSREMTSLSFLLFLAYYPPSAKWVSWVPGSVPQTKPSKLWRNIAKAFRPANYGGHEEVLTPNSEDSFDFRNATYSTMSSVRPGEQQVQTAASPEWRTSVNFAVLTGLHVAVCGFVTFLLLLLLPKASQPPVHPTPNPLPGPHQESHDARVVRLWATFLGVLSTLLAMCQYLVSGEK